MWRFAYFSCKESWFFCCSGQLRATITSSGLVPRVEGQGGSRTANLAEKPEMVRPFCLGRSHPHDANQRCHQSSQPDLTFLVD